MPQHESRRISSKAAYLKIGAMGLVCLATILCMVGCNIRQSGQLPDKFWAGVRPPSGENERLLRNFRYLKAAGRTELALRELEVARQQDPGNLTIIDILAQCYEELGAWDRAEKLYLEALAHDRDNPALANNLCFSYYQAGKFDKAESCFRDLLKRQPQNATVRNNLGLLLVKTGRQEEAIRLWREHDSDAAARARLNQALAALGLAPPMTVARQAEADQNNKDTAAAPPAEAAPSTLPTPEKIAVMAAPAPPAQATQRPAPLTAPAPPKPPKIAAVPVRPEKPAQSGIQAASGKTVASQAAGPAVSPGASATVPETSRPAARPEYATHLASSTEKAAPEAPVAEAASAPVKPVAAPSPTPEPQAAPAAAPVKSDAADVQPPAKPETPAAPVSPSPGKIKVKVAAQKSSQPVSAPIEPKRPVFLSTRELVDTRLEIKNGNGVKGIAALNRTWLSLEGFHVAAIGNHIDFGKEKTEIAYQPQAERVALVLRKDFFPQADLRPAAKLGKGADVRITLGHDQKSRTGQIEERIALLDLKAQLAGILAASGKAATAPPAAPSPKRAEPQTAQAPETPIVKPPAPVEVSEPISDTPINLSAAELVKTRIELRNGNGVQDQARKLRSEMELQGFNVVGIKNHIDFGMQQTKILYRPGSQRMAQALEQKYFRTARVQEAANLPETVDVKVILGKDLPGSLDLMATLAR